MKYLKSYELFESKSDDSVIDIINGFKDKIDVEKLSKLIISYKDYFYRLIKKYSKDGIIDSDKVMMDVKSFRFGTNESRNQGFISKSFDIISDYFVKILKFPFELGKRLWDIFNDVINYDLTEILEFFAKILTAIVVFLLGLGIYLIGEHAFNGLKSGRVVSKKFIEHHYETHVHHSNNRTWTTSDYVPDTWNVEVKGEGGRVEIWKTYEEPVGTGVKNGDVIKFDDNWIWTTTLEFGDKDSNSY